MGAQPGSHFLASPCTLNLVPRTRMSSENEELREQVAALSERVARLESELVKLRSGRTPVNPESATHPGQSESPSRAAVFSLPETHQRPTEAAPGKKSTEQQGWRRSRVPLDAQSSQGGQPTLETRIGSQLFNRIGILAVLIGAAWFLKFAIDNHWIGPAGRVLTGLLSGAALFAWSERFRARGYTAFSYSLKAIATGILYLSLWAAYSLFHLIPGGFAFLAMVLVTAMNALMCWIQNSEVLAFYAAIGGFLTPLLLSTGESNELVLFGYLLLLDVAVVVLIALRPWSRLLLAAFAGTTFYALGWYWSRYSENAFGLTLFFILIFFLLFAAAPQLLRSLRLASAPTAKQSLTLEILPPLNAALAFFEMHSLFSGSENYTLRHWIALPFAVFYFAMLRLTQSRSQSHAPAALPGIYSAIGVFFVTLFVLTAAHGRLIAAGWWIEFAVLLWLAVKKDSHALRVIAACVFVLALIALFTPTDFFNPPASPTLLANTRFATYLVAIAATLFAARISSTRKQTDATRPTWPSLFIATGLTATALAMIAVCLEIHSYWSVQGIVPALYQIDEQFSYSAWSMLFGAFLLAAGFVRMMPFLRWQALVLLSLSIAKVFLFDMRQLSQGYRILSFLGLGVLLLTVSFAYQRDWLNLRRPSEK